MTDISTFDALATLMTFVVALFFSSMAIGRRSYICSYLAMLSWFIFGELFIIDSAFGSFMVVGFMWWGFAILFMAIGIALSLDAWNEHARRKEFEV